MDTQEQRMRKEAEAYGAKLNIGKSATMFSRFSTEAYISGATIEAARNKENAIAFVKWLFPDDEILPRLKHRYDLFIEQNKKV